MFWCVCNTTSLADRHMAGRQEARGSTLRYGDGAQIFFLEQRFMCVVLTQPEGSPSMRNLVPTKTSTTQHRVQLESSPLDSPHQHNRPLHLQINLARFGFCPPNSTMGENWEIKHLRDLPDFMFPEKQYVGLRVFWPCTASVLGGMW